MQWLIDIVVEAVLAAIGIPPVYIWRGDPGPVDYVVGDLTIDDNWHVLDISSIVPAGAQAVDIRVTYTNTTINRELAFKKEGQTFGTVGLSFITQVASLANKGNGLIALNDDRKIEYKVRDAGNWLGISITIKGWIL